MTCTPEAYRLFHEGAIALASIESVGVGVDMEYLHKVKKDISKRISDLESEMRGMDLYKSLRRRHGEKTNMGSRQQLAKIMFGELGHKAKAQTATGQDKMDKAFLEEIDDPYVKHFLKVERLKRDGGTYIEGILREVVNGRVHPSYSLNTVVTYRSSCTNPNFQNIPARDPEQADLIRRCYIPSKGHQLLEVDCAGAEVRIAACYHKDPTMIAYINDKSKDMHRDMASEIYMLKQEHITKLHRYCGKNKYVFPVFYGSYYIQTAKALWEAIDSMQLAGPSPDVTLKEHLKSKGIRKLGACDPSKPAQPGTFEHHMKKVEDAFWTTRFPVYAKWKKTWFAKYQETGSFMMKTGFHVNVPLKRNDVINYPVQGASFHCLLWSLIQITKWLKKNKMRSKIVGQIHDSLVFDAHPKEVQEILAKCHSVMTVDLRNAWKWIIVPLEIEAEIAPVDASWIAKKHIDIPTA